MLNESKLERTKLLEIDCQASLLAALKKMDELDRKLLLVNKQGKYFGLLSIGDIQRAIISNSSLETKVELVVRASARVAHVNDSFEAIKELMIKFRTEFMPVVNESGDLIDIHFWKDIFSDHRPNRRQINYPVVIMAGGKGTRLKPFSNVLPKPLFPLGEKTIVENIMDRFRDAGCDQFFMSVNYKADFIEAYFDQPEIDDYQLEFFREPKPLGTAGSLQLIQDKIKETFFVTNCDIIVDSDYSEIIDYHKSEKNEITLVAALKHMKIPYGTLETVEGGQLINISEKPELTYLINAGMYVLEPHLLSEIPDDTFFHITHLIEAVMKREGKVGVFPVSEKSWSDIGQWEQYNNVLTAFKL